MFFLLLQAHSWWPWRSSLGEGKCVLRTQDGWLKRPCDEQQAFICEREIHRQLIPLTVRCGNAQTTLSSTLITTTTIPIRTTSTSRPTVSFIQPPVEHDHIPSPVYKQQHLFVPAVSPSISTDKPKTTIETKTNSIDPSKNPPPSLSLLIHFPLDILAAILGGIAIAIFSVNIVVCYICKR